ncbi:hypothetical protein LINPERPRIM_LOCUS20526, partial [Linum perenne]
RDLSSLSDSPTYLEIKTESLSFVNKVSFLRKVLSFRNHWFYT